jgi:hypothetical protein
MLENQAKGPGKWSRKREAAIFALITYDTIRDAAKYLRVHETTLYRWQRDADFQRDYSAAKLNVLTLASDELRNGSLEAVKTLRSVLRDKKAPASARVQACRTFLEANKLLEGLSVTVNNSTLPQTQEGCMEQIVAQLGAMLKTDPALRDAVVRLVADLEAKDANTERQN